MLGAHGVVLAVAANGDGAQQVGAVHVHPGVPQDAQGLLMRVAVFVVHPAGDDAHLRQDRVQEGIAGGGAGTVVAHLQHIGFQIGTAGHKVALCGLFHVTGKQKAGGTVVDAQHDGGIVGVAVLRHGAQHGHASTAQGPGGAHGGHFHLQALLLGVLDKIPEALGGGLRHRAVYMIGREVGQRSRQAAYMVLVGVGAEYILQLFHPLLLQVGHHQAAVVHVAAVVQHELAVTFHQHAQRLPHVDEVHLERGIHAGCRRGRVGHHVGTAARHHSRGTTAYKAQGQCGRSGQRQQPLQQALLSGHFFFFPVFHVAFSFC